MQSLLYFLCDSSLRSWRSLRLNLLLLQGAIFFQPLLIFHTTKVSDFKSPQLRKFNRNDREGNAKFIVLTMRSLFALMAYSRLNLRNLKIKLVAQHRHYARLVFQHPLIHGRIIAAGKAICVFQPQHILNVDGQLPGTPLFIFP
jgi:hypothetical protein